MKQLSWPQRYAKKIVIIYNRAYCGIIADSRSAVNTKHIKHFGAHKQRLSTIRYAKTRPQRQRPLIIKEIKTRPLITWT